MQVTPLYAGLLAIWFVVLSARVIQKRRAGISLGDGGDAGMLRRIRAHANFAEYVPFVLVMMAVLESSGTSVYALHAIGVALLLGRLLHGYAFSFSDSFPVGRVAGTVLTLSTLVVSGALCIVQSIGSR
jgi:uncharacterized membrane protein YecN with MAPEG domain